MAHAYFHGDELAKATGLFQLALNGQTQGSEFDLIDHEVYARLLSAYGVDGRIAA